MSLPPRSPSFPPPPNRCTLPPKPSSPTQKTPQNEGGANKLTGQYAHPIPVTHSGGSAGTDETLQGSKIEPLQGKEDVGTRKTEGLSDEGVDGARIQPLGEVREEMG